jgi:D-alanine transaminase
LVYLNGNFVQKDKAYISVMDRGFLFGDGVYEVFPIYNNNVFGLDSHLNRLQAGLDAINIKNPHSNIEWLGLIKKIISFNKDINQAVYLQVSRGCDDDRKHTHNILTPTVYIQSTGIQPRTKDSLLSGKSVISREDIRWLQCNTKATSLLANIMYSQEAKELGSEEAILYRDNVVTEGSSSNVFIVKNDCIFTHPKGQHILPGITREVIIKIAKLLNLKIKENAFDMTSLMNADEVWITSSTREILPITTVDNKIINNGLAGPIWSVIYDQYQSLKALKE